MSRVPFDSQPRELRYTCSCGLASRTRRVLISFIHITIIIKKNPLSGTFFNNNGAPDRIVYSHDLMSRVPFDSQPRELRYTCSCGLASRTRRVLISFIHITIIIKKNPLSGTFFNNNGAPRRIRTRSLLIRSQMLYPVKLWAQQKLFYTKTFQIARKI